MGVFSYSAIAPLKKGEAMKNPSSVVEVLRFRCHCKEDAIPYSKYLFTLYNCNSRDPVVYLVAKHDFNIRSDPNTGDVIIYKKAN